jgi:methylated-DNA-protein-cysteine methyltransferase related protein
MPLSPFSKACQLVYETVREIPAGKVSTYSDIAKASGVNSPRLVGTCLHLNPHHDSIPCHRVVNAAGKLAPTFAFGGAENQKKYLAQEGVAFQKDQVDLSKSRYSFELTRGK